MSNITRAIAAVLSEYAYGDFIAVDEEPVYIGEGTNKYYFLKNMSKDDAYVFGTRSRDKIMFAFRGTTSGSEALETWPVIATSTEYAQRNFWSSYFNDRVDFVKNTLQKMKLTNETTAVYTAGHSLGGSTARVTGVALKKAGYNTTSYVFNQGSGVMASKTIAVLAKRFLETHVNTAVKWLYVNNPELGQAIELLKRQTVDRYIDSWTDDRRFHPEHVEKHRTFGDVVSFLSAFDVGGDSVNQWYNNPSGSWYDVLSHHDMTILKNQILSEMNSDTTSVKEGEEEEEERRHSFSLFRMQRQRVAVDPIDPLHPRIHSAEPWVTLSRANFINDINKFNILD